MGAQWKSGNVAHRLAYAGEHAEDDAVEAKVVVLVERPQMTVRRDAVGSARAAR